MRIKPHLTPDEWECLGAHHKLLREMCGKCIGAFDGSGRFTIAEISKGTHPLVKYLDVEGRTQAESKMFSDYEWRRAEHPEEELPYQREDELLHVFHGPIASDGRWEVDTRIRRLAVEILKEMIEDIEGEQK